MTLAPNLRNHFRPTDRPTPDRFTWSPCRFDSEPRQTRKVQFEHRRPLADAPHPYRKMIAADGHHTLLPGTGEERRTRRLRTRNSPRDQHLAGHRDGRED